MFELSGFYCIMSFSRQILKNVVSFCRHSHPIIHQKAAISIYNIEFYTVVTVEYSAQYLRNCIELIIENIQTQNRTIVCFC